MKKNDNKSQINNPEVKLTEASPHKNGDGIMQAHSKFRWKTAIKIFISLVLILVLCIIGLVLYYMNTLPNIKNINEEGYELTSRLYTKDGILMKEYAQTSRKYIPLSEIPPHVINAFLAAEDANFFNNMGIDIRGIFRATVTNIKNKLTGNHSLQGASTITQQLVKNMVLTSEKTFERKIKEIILSIIITKELSKQEILELYLNYIFFGHNAYGIESASLEYFGKHAKNLNIQEAASLAAIPKAPSMVNPRANAKKHIERRNWVIEQMLIDGFIDEKLAFVAKQTPIGHKKKSDFQEERSGYNAVADHIMLNEMKILRINDLFTNGYFIKSTVDSHIQEALFNSVQTHLNNYQKRYGRPLNAIKFTKNWCTELGDIAARYRAPENSEYGVGLEYEGMYSMKIGIRRGGKCFYARSIALEHVPYNMGIVILERQSNSQITKLRLPKSVEKQFKRNPLLTKPVLQPNAGAVVMNAKNGKILAMVGDYFDTPNGFNRATKSSRQLGSAIKPFVYQAAFENGYSPAAIFVDEPITIGNWHPENANMEYLGPITLRRSLELSRNIPTVRLADTIGYEAIKNMFVRFGLSNPSDEINLSAALGTISVTPLKAAQGYSAYINQGKTIKPSYIEYIQNRNGKIIYKNNAVTCENCDNENEIPSVRNNNLSKELISPQVAYQIYSILEGTAQRGTAASVGRTFGRGIAGKTGTTNDSKDSWFVGFNDKVIIAIYAGFDEPKTLGNEFGATIAMPIFIDTMKHIIKRYPSSQIQIPFGITPIAINYKTGKKANDGDEGTITEFFKTGDQIPEYQNSNGELYGY
jgi:penicillin-binding protein 1A